MKIITKSSALKDYLINSIRSGQQIGFIPTMGALHEGHLELLKRSREQNAFSVCSIFVNPTQFNNAVDFEKYPKTLEQDAALLKAAQADLLFIPEVEEIYPGGISHLEKFDLGYLETILEGSSRPGHFQGVCQVMQRLLTIVQPHLLFMGQKDYQQCMVVDRLIKIMKSDIQLITVPTVRQEDGLALSSRNRRLTDIGRTKASAIYQVMKFVAETVKPGPLEPVRQSAREKLTDKGFVVDYVEIADARDLRLIADWDGHSPLVCLVAAFLEEVRLIDNLELRMPT